MGHLARSHPVDRGQIGVVEDDLAARVGEGQTQGQPHVAAPSENRYVVLPPTWHPSKLAKPRIWELGQSGVATDGVRVPASPRG